MRKYVTGIGCTLVAAGLALSAAPAAHADDAGFVAAARGLGMHQSADYVIRSGHSACLLLNMGSTPDKLANRMMTTGLDQDQARQFIALSVHDFCPQFDGQLAPRRT